MTVKNVVLYAHPDAGFASPEGQAGVTDHQHVAPPGPRLFVAVPGE